MDLAAEHVASGRGGRWERAMGLVLGAVLLVGAVAWAWPTMFSQFRDYDDEGYMMLSIRHMLDGRVLYDEVAVPYGPAYYAYRWVLHGVLRVPLTHDAVRLSTLAVWVLTAGVMGGVVWRAGGAVGMGLGALGFAAVMLHLKGLVNEPGHPQDIATLLVAVGVLVGWGGTAAEAAPTAAPTAAPVLQRGRAIMLGAVGGALLLVKLNVGVLFIAACAVCLAVPWPGVRLLFAAGAVALPALVMRRHLGMLWAGQFCLVVTLGILSCCMVAMRQRDGARSGGRTLLWWLAGIGAAAAVALGFAVLRGSSFAAIVECLFTRALRFPDAFAVAIPVSRGGLYYGLAGAVLAAACAFGRGRARWMVEQAGLPILKLVFGVAVSAQCAGYNLLPGTAHGWHFDFAVPFLWMVLVAPEGRGVFIRRLLAFVAALQVMQMYPVPGTQAMVGTAAIPAIAALWLGDGLYWIARLLPSGAVGRIPRLANQLPTLAAIVVLAIFAQRQYGIYRQNDRLRLPGSTLMRLPESQAANFRCLAETASASADLVVSNIGFNSLSFWSGHPPATSRMVGYTWDFITEAEQQDIVVQVQRHERPLYLHRDWIFAPPKRPVALVDYAARELKTAGRVGPYTLMTRLEHPSIAWRSCAFPAGRQVELEVRVRGAGAAERASFAVLALSLPAELAGRQVTAVELVDLARGRTLAKTQVTRADKLVLLLDGADQVLLGDNDHRAAVTAPADATGWKLAIPAPLDLADCRLPALRFYRQQTRLATVPVVSPGRGE